MMGSDMNESRVRHAATRRVWLAHCSLLALGLWAAGANAATPAATASPKAATILVVGDSLSAEYGLPRGAGWVALLEPRLAKEGFAASVVFGGELLGHLFARLRFVGTRLRNANEDCQAS